MDRGEMARGSAMPAPKTKMQDYENNPNKNGLTFIFAEHEVNINRLAVMVQCACMTHVSITDCRSLCLVNDVLSNQDSDEVEAFEESCDLIETPSIFRKNKYHMSIYHAVHLIHGSGYGLCIVQEDSSIAGAVEFARLIEEEHNIRIRIAFIRKGNCPAYNENVDLGDILIEESILYSDPINTLLRLKPMHYPNENVLKKILNNEAI